jgi:hypothetical protein
MSNQANTSVEVPGFLLAVVACLALASWGSVAHAQGAEAPEEVRVELPENEGTAQVSTTREEADSEDRIQSWCRERWPEASAEWRACVEEQGKAGELLRRLRASDPLAEPIDELCADTHPVDLVERLRCRSEMRGQLVWNAGERGSSFRSTTYKAIQTACLYERPEDDLKWASCVERKAIALGKRRSAPAAPSLAAYVAGAITRRTSGGVFVSGTPRGTLRGHVIGGGGIGFQVQVPPVGTGVLPVFSVEVVAETMAAHWQSEFGAGITNPRIVGTLTRFAFLGEASMRFFPTFFSKPRSVPDAYRRLHRLNPFLDLGVKGGFSVTRARLNGGSWSGRGSLSERSPWLVGARASVGLRAPLGHPARSASALEPSFGVSLWPGRKSVTGTKTLITFELRVAFVFSSDPRRALVRYAGLGSS